MRAVRSLPRTAAAVLAACALGAPVLPADAGEPAGGFAVPTRAHWNTYYDYAFQTQAYQPTTGTVVCDTGAGLLRVQVQSVYADFRGAGLGPQTPEAGGGSAFAVTYAVGPAVLDGPAGPTAYDRVQLVFDMPWDARFTRTYRAVEVHTTVAVRVWTNSAPERSCGTLTLDANAAGDPVTGTAVVTYRFGTA